MAHPERNRSGSICGGSRPQVAHYVVIGKIFFGRAVVIRRSHNDMAFNLRRTGDIAGKRVAVVINIHCFKLHDLARDHAEIEGIGKIAVGYSDLVIPGVEHGTGRISGQSITAVSDFLAQRPVVILRIYGNMIGYYGNILIVVYV